LPGWEFWSAVGSGAVVLLSGLSGDVPSVAVGLVVAVDFLVGVRFAAVVFGWVVLGWVAFAVVVLVAVFFAVVFFAGVFRAGVLPVDLRAADLRGSDSDTIGSPTWATSGQM
jgi:hypothetical protein